MQVARWVSAERTPFERGLAFGRGLAPAVANTVAVYRRMLREDIGLDDVQVAQRGREVAAVVEGFRPELARELEGMAAGSGQPLALLFAVNARTELLNGGTVAGATAGECSTVGVADDADGRAILAQTWDFHPDLAASRVAWTVRREGGVSFTGLTEAGILAKLGVSSYGLAVGMNFLATDRDSGRGGVPVHVLARVVLEEARTVSEASELVARTPMASSVCLTVAGPNGDGTIGVVSLERWPGGVGWHVASGVPTRVVHTNHFIEPIAAVDVLGSGPHGAGSRSRYQQLVDALAGGARCDVAAVARQLSSVGCPPGGQAVFRRVDETPPWLERSATLATVAFEVPAGRFWLRDGFDPDRPLELVDDVGAGS